MENSIASMGVSHYSIKHALLLSQFLVFGNTQCVILNHVTGHIALPVQQPNMLIWPINSSSDTCRICFAIIVVYTMVLLSIIDV